MKDLPLYSSDPDIPWLPCSMVPCATVVLNIKLISYYHIYLAIRQGFTLSRMTTQITKSVVCNFAVIQVLLSLNNHKNLAVSRKMDLDYWDCFGRKKTLSYNRRNKYYRCMLTHIWTGCHYKRNILSRIMN